MSTVTKTPRTKIYFYKFKGSSNKRRANLLANRLMKVNISPSAYGFK